MFLRFFSSFLSFIFFVFCLLATIFTRKKKFFSKIKNTFSAPTSDKERIWFHAASVGEVALVQKITQKWQLDFFITTNTLGGLQQAKKFQPRSYLAPLDFSFSVWLWKKKMKAKGLILIEAEIWVNLISIMAKSTPVSLINGRVELRHSYWNKMLYRQVLPKFSLVTASNEKVNHFYQSLSDNPNIYYFGNLKFLVEQKRDTQKKSAAIKKYFPKDAFIFVAASLQPEELPIILKSLKQVWKKSKTVYLVIIPRHPEKKKQFLKHLSTAAFQTLESRPNKPILDKIILVPLLGVLHDWYAAADSIFVGGSLCNRGGQNMIEALYYATPTASGYNTKNFEFAMKLFLAKNLIVRVHNDEELATFIDDAMQNPKKFPVKLAPKIIAEQAKSFPKTISLLQKTYPL